MSTEPDFTMPIKPFPKISNIHVIAIPLPVQAQLMTANVYAVGNGPLTLIDTGPKMPGFLKFIRQALQRLGFDMQDVARIIATHGHMDHIGLAARIREAAGHAVDFFIHPEDVRLVSQDSWRHDQWSEQADQLMAWAGVPAGEIDKMRRHFSSFGAWYDPVDDLAGVKDGDEFAGEGFRLQVIYTPGHTAGSICLYEPEQKILFSGDCLIKHITPNPVVEVQKFRLQDPDYLSLKAYLDSLDKLARLDVRYVFSGHGECIADIKSLIASYQAHHRQRMHLVWRALKRKQRPLYMIIDEVFPFVPEGDGFLAVSEIVVHLEMLIREGRVKLVEPGPPALYRAL